LNADVSMSPDGLNLKNYHLIRQLNAFCFFFVAHY